MNLFFRKVGETGQAIVILHGVFGSSDNWATIQKQMAEAGLTSYALDARNHGRSPWSDEFSYEIMADDLFDFLHQNGISEPIIIGHSMGGKVSMQFAMKYPDAYSKMIIVDIAPKFYPTHHDHIIQAFNKLDLSSFKSRTEVEQAFAQYVPDFGERQFLLKNLAREADNAFFWRINVPVLSKEIYQIGGELTNVQPQVKPILFIIGAKSSYVEESDYGVIKAIFPNAIFKVIDGAGHWVQAEQPQAFLAAVKAFIA